VLTWLCATSFVAWTAFMTYLLLGTPAGDYAVYRSLTPAVLDGRSLYDMRLGELGFTYPSFAALPLSLLSNVDFNVGFAVFTLLGIAALARVTYLLSRAVLRERGVLRIGSLRLTPITLALIAFAVVIWFAPVTKTLLNGQINLILLWLVVEDLIGDVPRRWRGILTGIATGLKLTPGLFIVAMLLTGRTTWAARAFAAFGATVAIGFVAEPIGSVKYWLTLGGSGNAYGTPEGYSNQSLMYMFVRFTDASAYQVFIPIAAAVIVGALVLVRRLHLRGYTLAPWGVTALAMLITSPISWSHQWVWMVLPLAALLTISPLRASARALMAVTALVLCSGVVSLATHMDFTGIGRILLTETAGNAYLIVGFALLGWFAALSMRRDRELSVVDETIRL
jgi:alpha-1,2-mannosyltransferase